MREYTWARLLCKKTIDDMIARLLKKKMDEIKHKDFCTDDLNIKQVEKSKSQRANDSLRTEVERQVTACLRSPVCRTSGGLPLASARRVGTAGCRPGVHIYSQYSWEFPEISGLSQ